MSRSIGDFELPQQNHIRELRQLLWENLPAPVSRKTRFTFDINQQACPRLLLVHPHSGPRASTGRHVEVLPMQERQPHRACCGEVSRLWTRALQRIMRASQDFLGGGRHCRCVTGASLRRQYPKPVPSVRIFALCKLSNVWPCLVLVERLQRCILQIFRYGWHAIFPLR